MILTKDKLMLFILSRNPSWTELKHEYPSEKGYSNVNQLIAELIKERSVTSGDGRHHVTEYGKNQYGF